MIENIVPYTAKDKDTLDDLTRTFKPTDVKFLLALNKDFSKEECIDDAQAMIGRLKKFVGSGLQNIGDGFNYSDITGF